MPNTWKPAEPQAPDSPAPNAFDDNRNPITLSVSNGEPQAPAQGEVRVWPKEMLDNLNSSLKLQAMLAAPDHAWIGPSVIELAQQAYDALKAERDAALTRLAVAEGAQLALQTEVERLKTKDAKLIHVLNKTLGSNNERNPHLGVAAGAALLAAELAEARADLSKGKL